MSTTNEILDAFAARLAVIDPNYTIRRNQGESFESIAAAQFPVAYLSVASEVRQRIDWRQYLVVLLIRCEIWRDDGQVELYDAVTAITNDILADPYMGLTDLEDSMIAEWDPAELPEQRPIAAGLIMEVRRFE